MVGGVTFLALVALDAIGVWAFGAWNQAGFLRICGPYGSDSALVVMVVLFVVGLAVAFWGGLRVARVAARGRPDAGA